MSAPASDAAVWHGRRDVRVEPHPPSSNVAPGWVQLRVEWCGICGSDVEEYLHGPVMIPERDGAGPGPLVLGHEFAGVVSALGPGVEGVQVGDRVAVDTLLACGRCFWCRHGDFNVCPQLEVVGLTLPGGLAQYVDVPMQTCHRVPAELGLDLASLAEPLAVALRALSRGGMTMQTPVAVVGCGSIGLLCIAAASAGGASRIVAVEPHAARRALAVEAGASSVVRELNVDVFDSARPWLALDCTPGAKGLAAIVAHAPQQSRVVVLGVGTEPVPVDTTAVMSKELTLLGSVAHNAEDFRRAVEMLAQPTRDFGWIVAERIPLRDVPDAFQRLSNGGAVVGKFIVSLRAGSGGSS